MQRDLLLALDLGTSRVRALLVEPGGPVRSRASRTLGTRFPGPGWVEQDPAEMWQQSLAVLREALASAGATAADVAALGVVSQRGSVVAWDARNAAPLAHAIGWQDQRTAERCAELRAQGIPIHSQASATKCEWLLHRVPAVKEAARRGTLRLGTPDAWLTDRLTAGCAFVTDPGQASCTALYDLSAGDWSARAMALFSVPESCLPRVVASCEIVGESPPGLLGSALPVAARAGDQQAASFAQGVHEEGQAKLTLGTSAMLDVHTGRGVARGGPGTYPLALWRLPGGGDATCLEGTVLTAGASVEWLARLGLLPDAEALDRVARSVADSGGVCFVPALQGLGTPYMDDAARGLLTGLTRGTTSAHLARATLEGVAQRCADLCEAVDLRSGALPVDGGLARSDLLLQTLADFTGRRVERAAETETTALGAAQLAGLATGVLQDLSACRDALAPPRGFEPRMAEPERRQARALWARTVALARSRR